ncbi:bifunctional aspartate transaminase/aspartate 4-decarboxylase [Lactobacillus selangorensis]|nr:bifunctional aspartate transaminase/aspartate 4-decarboxylase [Lactobacillus selangorensis]
MSSRSDREKQVEKLSAFTISAGMSKLAQESSAHSFLNASRGNPNWINTKARLAFARLVQFGAQESQRTLHRGDLAGYVQQEGIAQRFLDFLQPNDATDQFLQQSYTYLTDTLSMDGDTAIKGLIDGVIGNNYPAPSRSLSVVEPILNHYLEKNLYHGVPLADTTEVFPTEGGTAAIVYLFHALRENHLINPGDKIAINAPIFTPYLEIPTLNDYELVELDLTSTAENHWEIDSRQIAKLADPSIKLFITVNPSNPGSMAMTPQALSELQAAVAKNPNLMIVTDDVYATFADHFQSIYAVLPYNTLLVYSFSKLYGATGWRVGLVAAHDKNVYDQLIHEKSAAIHERMGKRYGRIALHPEEMKFIDRMVADSRSIGLYHTSGLSTPQQVMMALFSLTNLVCGDQPDPYITASKKLINDRYRDFFDALEIPANESPHNTKYYALINIYKLAAIRYDQAFADYLKENYEEIDFGMRLAEMHGTVLMDGTGFGAQAGTLRVSQANLANPDYRVIAKNILKLLDAYHAHYLAAQKDGNH